MSNRPIRSVLWDLILEGRVHGQECAGVVRLEVLCACGKRREVDMPLIAAHKLDAETLAKFPQAKAGEPLQWWGVKDCGCGRAYSVTVSTAPPPDLSFMRASES